MGEMKTSLTAPLYHERRVKRVQVNHQVDMGRNTTPREEFKHFLWRRHRRPRVYKDALPEILASDGSSVLRLASQDKQIVYQHLDDVQTASELVSRIEASITPGVAIMGYSMFEEHKSVAILNTGDASMPGWLAFPDARTSQGRAAFTGQFATTLPNHIANQPKLRLVAGVTLAWENRQLVLKAALEQRGSSFLKSPQGFHILDHLDAWTMQAIAYKDGVQRKMEVVHRQPLGKVERVHPLRVEASFVVEPYVYKEFQKADGQLWLEVSFGRGLFCLPESWSCFWMQVDVHEPVGMLF